MTPGVAHIARGDEAVHEAAEDDGVEGAAEEVFGGGPTATAGVAGLALLPHGSAPFRVEDGLATALSSHASLWRAEERDVTLAVTADAEEFSAVESSAMSVSGWVLLALLPEQSLGCAVGGEQALGEGAGCGKPGAGVCGIQGREGFREVEALGLRDAPQLGDGGAAVEG